MHTISPGAIQGLQLVAAGGNLADAPGSASCCLAFAAAGIQARRVPARHELVGARARRPAVRADAGILGFFAGLLVLPWMFAAGVSMFVRAGDTAPAGAPWVGVGSQTAPDVAR